jgi:hemolysin III
MGWAVVLVWKQVVHALPPTTLRLVIAGGLAYTSGAIVYATKRPNPWPARFGFHEIWHLFVLAGSTLHFAAIATLARA